MKKQIYPGNFKPKGRVCFKKSNKCYVARIKRRKRGFVKLILEQHMLVLCKRKILINQLVKNKVETFADFGLNYSWQINRKKIYKMNAKEL